MTFDAKGRTPLFEKELGDYYKTVYYKTDKS